MADAGAVGAVCTVAPADSCGLNSPRKREKKPTPAFTPALAAAAIGRNPDAAGQIRGIAIILAAFAEGLGVLAIVVGLLAIFIK